MAKETPIEQGASKEGNMWRRMWQGSYRESATERLRRHLPQMSVEGRGEET